MHYKIDAGLSDTNTALGLCLEPGCHHVRLLATSRDRALERLADHEAKEHPLTKNARSNLARGRRLREDSAA